MSSSAGKTLVELRDRARVTSEALARAVKVDQASIESFERTDKGLSIGAVERIARHFGVRAEDWLRGDLSASDSPRLFQNKRGPKDDLVDNESQELIAALAGARALRELNDLLHDSEDLRTALRPEAVGRVPYQDGYRLARRVRTLLGNAADPLPPLRKLLGRSFSIYIARGIFRPTIHAVSVKDRHGNAAILVNRRNPGIASLGWHRVNLAHELCHILFDELADGLDVVVDWGEDGPAPRGDAVRLEQRARAFAAELLIPLEGLNALLGPPRQATSERAALSKIRKVREHYQTTYEVALYHLVNQKYLASSLKGALQRSWSNEPDTGSRERIEPLWKRVQAAWSKGLVTSMRARELLGLSPWEPLPWADAIESGHAASS